MRWNGYVLIISQWLLLILCFSTEGLHLFTQIYYMLFYLLGMVWIEAQCRSVVFRYKKKRYIFTFAVVLYTPIVLSILLLLYKLFLGLGKLTA